MFYGGNALITAFFVIGFYGKMPALKGKRGSKMRF